MIKYKRVDTANGRVMYFKNGKMTSKDNLPVSLQNTLEAGSEVTLPSSDTIAQEDQIVEPENNQETVDGVEDSQAQLPKSERFCVFCGEPATRLTYVNLKTAHLCEEDKRFHTLGQIAAQLRKVAEESLKTN